MSGKLREANGQAVEGLGLSAGIPWAESAKLLQPSEENRDSAYLLATSVGLIELSGIGQNDIPNRIYLPVNNQNV